MRCAGYIVVSRSSIITVHNGYTYYHAYADAPICIYVWCNYLSYWKASSIHFSLGYFNRNPFTKLTTINLFTMKMYGLRND